MPPTAGKTDPAKQARIRAELRRDIELRQAGYRERALKLFPHVCARCAREFSGKRLKELTVHHKDHNYKHNPNDGSNWELLCEYCHENEHAAFSQRGRFDDVTALGGQEASAIANPFEGLEALVKPKPEDVPPDPGPRAKP